MEPLLSELGLAVDAIESRYCTSGQWLMPSALKLELSKDTSPVSFPMPHGQQEKELSRIRAAAEPSPFGHGNQTVVDTTVRKAHQLMPDQVSMSGGFNGTLPADVLESTFSRAQRPKALACRPTHPTAERRMFVLPRSRRGAVRAHPRRARHHCQAAQDQRLRKGWLLHQSQGHAALGDALWLARAPAASVLQGRCSLHRSRRRIHAFRLGEHGGARLSAFRVQLRGRPRGEDRRAHALGHAAIRRLLWRRHTPRVARDGGRTRDDRVRALPRRRA